MLLLYLKGHIISVKMFRTLHMGLSLRLRRVQIVLDGALYFGTIVVLVLLLLDDLVNPVHDRLKYNLATCTWWGSTVLMSATWRLLLMRRLKIGKESNHFGTYLTVLNLFSLSCDTSYTSRVVGSCNV